MAQGGIGLLSIAAANAEDPQTLRMIAGAIANLCGNGKPNSFSIHYSNLCCSCENDLMFSLFFICSVVLTVHYISYKCKDLNLYLGDHLLF